MRDWNTIAVLHAVRTKGPISRADLAQQLGLNRSTITHIVGRLVEEGLIKEAGQGDSSGGRPPTLLRFNDSAAYAACVIWSAARIGVHVCGLDGETVFSGEIRRETKSPLPRDAEAAAGMLREAAAGLSARPLGLLGVVLGVPGVIDRASHTVASYDLGWDRAPIAEAFRAALKLPGFDGPVFAENIATLGLAAERDFGAAAGEAHVVYLRLRQGITAGILLDGKVYRGASGFAGNAGHIVIEANGTPCACGSRGCWTNYASDDALLAHYARRAASPPVEMDEWLRRFRAGEKAAREALDEFAAYAGIGVAGLINLLNPGAVVVDSAANEAGEPFVHALRSAVERAALPYPKRNVKLLFSALGSRAVVLGGTAAVIDRVFAPPSIGRGA